jgi:DNA-binding protein HU-beta
MPGRLGGRFRPGGGQYQEENAPWEMAAPPMVLVTGGAAGEGPFAKEIRFMAKAAGKAMTKSEIATTLAEKSGLTKKQVSQLLEVQAELAYKQAKNSFTIPGIGKLVLVNRKARKGRNPQTGEEITIPAKRVVKFRVAKAAKDAILGVK